MQAESRKALFQDGFLNAIPDIVLPSQFFGSVGTQTFSSEQRLMLAVLTDAINIMGKYQVSPNRLKGGSFDEASAWVFGDGIKGPMSFDHVCDALGVNADTLRMRLSELVPRRGGSLLRLRLKEASRALPVTVNRVRRRRRLTETPLHVRAHPPGRKSS